ncbi:MAG: DUF748 domain-containing protein [Thermodesulfobacteriota bacterium]
MLRGLAGRPAFAGLGRDLAAASLALAHAAVLLAVLGMAAFPYLAQGYLREEASRGLGREIRLERLSFNPFTFELRAAGFSVADKDGGEPLASFTRLEIDLDPSAVLGRRLALNRLILEDPALRLTRGQDGRTNFEDILSPSSPEESRDGFRLDLFPSKVRFTLRDVRMSGGYFSFDDRLTGNRQEVKDLRFTIDSLASDRPGLNEIFSTGGLVNESSLALTVKADLSGPVTELEARLDLKDVVFRHYTPYILPLKRPLDLHMEEAGIWARVVLPGRGAVDARAWLEGNVKVSALSLLDKGERVAGFDTLTVQGAKADLDTGSVAVERVAVSSPFVKITRDEAGIIGLIALLEPAAPPMKKDAEKAPAARPAVSVARLELKGGSAGFVDEGLDLAIPLHGIDVSVTGLDVAAGSFEGIEARAEGDRFERLSVACKGGYAPLALTGKASMEGIDLAKPLPAFKRLMPRLGLAGKASYELDFSIRERDGRVEPVINAALEVRGFAAMAEGQARPLARADRVAVRNVTLDMAARSARVGEFLASGGEAVLERAKDGTFPGVYAVVPAGPAGKDAPGPAWTVTSGRAALTGFAVEYVDQAAGASFAADLEELSVTNASTAMTGPVGVSLRGRAMGDAVVGIDGEARPGSMAATLNAYVSGLPLPGLARLGPALPVRVLSGKTSLSGKVELSRGKDGLAASFAGDAGLSLLKLARPGGEAPFASATGIEVKGAEAALSSMTFKADKVLVDEPWLDLVLDKNGKPVPPVRTGGDKDGKPGLPGPSAADKGGGISPPFSYQLGTLEMRRGWLEITAQGYEPPLSWLLSGIEATLTDVRPGKPVRFGLSLAAGHTGRLKAEGAAGLVSDAVLMDFRAALSNMDLGELSPVSRRYTGFPIQRGKLGLKLDYKATPRELDLRNNVVVTGMQLGPKSPGPETGNIPLDLAVSLLSDGKGVIDLDIPVKGDPATATADLKDVISTAMAGMFAKVLFAPLAALNVQQGRGTTVYLPFAPGSAELGEEARKSLASLGEALADRPRMSLEVAAFVDQAAEKEALTKALSLPPGGKQGRTGLLFRKTPVAPGEPVEPGQADWAKLARLRQDAVLDFLASQGKLPQERVFPLSVDPLSPPAVNGQPGGRAEVRLRY